VPLQRNRRTLVLLVAPLVVFSVAGLTGSALTPPLLAHHPLALIMLNARNRNLVIVAGFVSAFPFFSVALVRRFLEDPFLYTLGQLYGDAAIRWVEHRTGAGGVVVRFIERWFRKASYVFVFLFPGGLVCVLAGATGMPPRTFFLLDLVGTLTVIGLLRLVGSSIATPVDTVRRFLSNHLLWTTALSIALTLGWLVYQRRRGSREIESIGEAVEDLEG